MTKPVIYQVFTRIFGNKAKETVFSGDISQNGCGKFNDISPVALSALKGMGITHMWYTGAIAHASLTDYTAFGIDNSFPEITKGRAGSPYAIRDYYDVDPDLAVNVAERMKEFEELVNRTHEAGMKVIIDFVPNHVARTYKSKGKPSRVHDLGKDDVTSEPFNPQNNFYYIPGEAFQVPDGVTPYGAGIPFENEKIHYKEFPARATGNDQFTARPGVNDWYETIKLNYGVDYLNWKQCRFDPVPATWVRMLEILTFWAKKGVDGFRCDMAEMVPVDFWEWVIKNIKIKFPHLTFIAEIYQPWEYRNYILRGGFDYLYDKEGMYNTLRDIIMWNKPAWTLSDCWRNLDNLDPYMLRFLENHDEIRLASGFFAGDCNRALPAMVVAATMNTGPVMIYMGQEVGEPAAGAQGFSGDDGRTSIFDYCVSPELQKWVNNGKFDGKKLNKEQQNLRVFYQKLLNLCNLSPAIRQGAFYDLMWVNNQFPAPDGSKIYVYLRHCREDQLLVICNFDQENIHRFRLFIPLHAFGEMNLEAHLEFSLLNLIGEPCDAIFTGYNAAHEGIVMEMQPNGYAIYRLQANRPVLAD